MLAVIARLDRAIQYAAASRLGTNASGILDAPPSRGKTAEGVMLACVTQPYPFNPVPP